DSMLAKLIVHGENRTAAIRKLRNALAATQILGLQTNLAFLGQLVATPAFAAADFHTRWIETQLEVDSETLLGPPLSTLQSHELALIATLADWAQREQSRQTWTGLPSGWRNSPGAHQYKGIQVGGQSLTVTYRARPELLFDMQVEDTRYQVRLLAAETQVLSLEIDGLRRHYSLAQAEAGLWIHHPALGCQWIGYAPRFPAAEGDQSHAGYSATMPGKILRVLVEVGQSVLAGQALMVLESMKMESTLCAACAGVVQQVWVSAGERVEAGTDLLLIDPIDPKVPDGQG
ncbi:MAG: hypothetical protein CVV27_07250, partial [Candidatus Melainabacteria bacterium HGW-Melainabacteria-1]